MKKLFLIISTLSVICFSVKAQDVPSPTPTEQFIDKALQSSNITAVVYGSYFNNNHKYGGGVMALYNIGPYVAAGLGSDYAGEWRMFSGTVNLHYTFKLSTKLSLDLYAIAAAGTSVGGANTDNGTLATAEGSGGQFKYQFTSNLNAGLGTAYIQRQNVGDYSGGSEIIALSVNLSF